MIWPRSRVWLVRTLPRGSRWKRPEISPAAEGKLTMEDDALVFRPLSPAEAPWMMPLGAIEKVKRTPGSAVLELRFRDGEPRRIVWFYFVQPPPRLPKGAGRGMRLHLAERGSGRLAMANALWGDEVTSWYERIRAALTERG